MADGVRVDCSGCGGDGQILLVRCPCHYREPWMGEVFESFSMLDQGFLPDPGGFYDQTAGFVGAVRAIREQRAASEPEQGSGPGSPDKNALIADAIARARKEKKGGKQLDG